MKLNPENWKVEKIGVIGPGIVGMPMAALLAHARICIGTDEPAKVIVIQRDSLTSGWKVDAINSGKSVIGGIEPELDHIVSKSVSDGVLSASHDYAKLCDADIVLVCIQTDKDGLGPDYGPMFAGLDNLAASLNDKPSHKIPLIIFESTLAPSSMMSLIKAFFAKHGLAEGRDILLGNSPNRVMPGRLVARVTESDKLVGGMSPVTPMLIKKLYANIVTSGFLHPANSLTAEIVKTLENAYRDVRIAFTTETVRYCDVNDIDFYQVRDGVNEMLQKVDAASADPNAVPSGGLLVPTIGVGGHCLPKDGILMLWRQLESGLDTDKSLFMESRMINDESPNQTILSTERAFGNLTGRNVALLGTAYRFNSEDTRNSPTLPLAKLILNKKCDVIMHDPFVKPDDHNLKQFNLQKYFTRDIQKALEKAEVVIFCAAHRSYYEERDVLQKSAPNLQCVFDGCNLFKKSDFNSSIGYAGIGRGSKTPDDTFIQFVHNSFLIVERGVANEVAAFIDFANDRYAEDDFNRVDFKEVQRLAATCATGCDIVDPGSIPDLPEYKGFIPRLVKCAKAAYDKNRC
jgi:UDP-N-acetyl-D-mannosaminuronic acid dehydrogenase